MLKSVIPVLCLSLLFSLGAQAAMNHSQFNDVLQSHVQAGMVDDGALKKDRVKLDQYLEACAKVNKATFQSWSDDEQLALLINLYNAATLQLIIDNYPVDSIKDIGSFFTGPWDQEFVELLGETITLNTLEHEIIRKDYDEPRIHFVLVCAAISCPKLRGSAYTGENLEKELKEETQRFLQDRTRNRYDAAADTLYLSSIFRWYGGDFKGHGPSLQEYLKPYLPKAAGERVTASTRIRYQSYDWSLNDKQN